MTITAPSKEDDHPKINMRIDAKFVYIRELPVENLVEIITVYDKLVKLYTDE